MDKRLKKALIFFLISLVVLVVLIIKVKLFGNPGQKMGSNTGSPTPSSAPTATASVEPSPAQSPTPTETPTPSNEATPETHDPDEGKLTIRTDYSNFNPNESGEIPIIMFHTFIEAYKPDTEKDYTTTFAEFEALLQTLYDQGYRLISMKDFIECNINVPAGTRPVVFTFDDGKESQFNLIEKDGKLEVNPKTAAGIMVEFAKTHPDFGLKGIFYVNMDIGNSVFKGAGTLTERFDYMQSLGFEIGNHTYGHVNYKELKTKDAIIESLGKNQEEAYKQNPDLTFYSLALPFGSLPADKSLYPYLAEGDYKDIHYKYLTIMAVGANPSVPSISPKYNPEYVRRIRAQGRVSVDADLTWWLPKMTEDRMFISDGDPKTIVVPEAKKDNVNASLLNGKELISY